MRVSAPLRGFHAVRERSFIHHGRHAGFDRVSGGVDGDAVAVAFAHRHVRDGIRVERPVRGDVG